MNLALCHVIGDVHFTFSQPSNRCLLKIKPLATSTPSQPRLGTAGQSQQVLVEPGDGLVEGLLLGPLLDAVGQVAADGEAMRDAREEVDLVGLAGLAEDLLGAVALVGGEDLVRLGGGDGERAGDGGQLVLLDEGRVGDEADVDAVLVVADDVLLQVSQSRLLS